MSSLKVMHLFMSEFLGASSNDYVNTLGGKPILMPVLHTSWLRKTPFTCLLQGFGCGVSQLLLSVVQLSFELRV